MLEPEIIINKLESEGIDKSLASGINFETEEALNSWVGVAKTFVEKPKSIENYTAEELEALLKEPQPKAKGLQSLMDRERTRIKEKLGKQEPPKAAPAESDEAKALRERLEALEAGINKSNETIATEKRNAFIEKQVAGLDPLEVTLMKNAIPKDATEAEITKQISDYLNLQAKRGLKSYVTSESAGKKTGEDPYMDESVKRILEKRSKK